MRTMDFTTEQPDCCSVGDYLEIVEHELPTSYWYMLEHIPIGSGKLMFDNLQIITDRAAIWLFCSKVHCSHTLTFCFVSIESIIL